MKYYYTENLQNDPKETFSIDAEQWTGNNPEAIQKITGGTVAQLNDHTLLVQGKGGVWRVPQGEYILVFNPGLWGTMEETAFKRNYAPVLIEPPEPKAAINQSTSTAVGPNPYTTNEPD